MRFTTAIPGHKAAGLISTTLPDDGLLAPGAPVLAVALERAAAAIARLDSALAAHPLAPGLGLSRPARRGPPAGRGRRQ